MKIKLSENQCKRLNIINEETDILSNLRDTAKNVSDKLDVIQSKLTFVTLGEIFNNEIPLDDISDAINALERLFTGVYKNISDWLYHKAPDEKKFSDMLEEVEDIDYRISNKFSALDFVLFPLKEVAEKAIEHEMNKNYPNKEIKI